MTSPKFSTTMRSTTSMIAFTRCSTQTMATLVLSRTRRMRRIESSTSVGFRPLIASSISSTRGAMARARASSTFFRSWRFRLAMDESRRAPRPTSSSISEGSVCLSFCDPKTEPMATFSSTVMLWNERGVCRVRAIPIRAMACVLSPVRSRPPKSTLPLEGRSTPDSRLSSVVLPAPLGPIRPTISPAAAPKLTSFSAAVPPKCLLSACASRRASFPRNIRLRGLGAEDHLRAPARRGVHLARGGLFVGVQDRGALPHLAPLGVGNRPRVAVDLEAARADRLREGSRVGGLGPGDRRSDHLDDGVARERVVVEQALGLRVVLRREVLVRRALEIDAGIVGEAAEHQLTDAVDHELGRVPGADDRPLQAELDRLAHDGRVAGRVAGGDDDLGIDRLELAQVRREVALGHRRHLELQAHAGERLDVLLHRLAHGVPPGVVGDDDADAGVLFLLDEAGDIGHAHRRGRQAGAEGVAAVLGEDLVRARHGEEERHFLRFGLARHGEAHVARDHSARGDDALALDEILEGGDALVRVVAVVALDELDRPAVHAAGAVHLGDGELHAVAHLDAPGGERSGKRAQEGDLDRLLRMGFARSHRRESNGQQRSGEPNAPALAHGSILLYEEWRMVRLEAPALIYLKRTPSAPA